MMRSLYLPVILVTICTLGAAPNGKTPNLSGIWKWNLQKSHHSGQPPDDMRLKIEQEGPDLTMILITHHKGVEDVMNFRYHIGSNENRGELHGGSMKSSARWQGDVLAIDSVVMYGTDELRLNDLWTLSSEGQTLTFREHHQFKTDPAGEDVDVFDKQAEGTWQPPDTTKPAEAVYKNIQVLKGVPASRVPVVMAFFGKCLGVDCSHCHVPNEFEKDDKTAKLTARRMLTMVHQINDNTFSGQGLVSCWTCHRGNVKPESLPK